MLLQFTNNKIKQEQEMERSYFQKHVQETIRFILGKVDEEIDTRKVIEKMPLFLMKSLGRTVQENMQGIVHLADGLENYCRDEQLACIPKIDKDSLMPKDLSEEKGQKVSPDLNSPRTSKASFKKTFKKEGNSSEKLQSKLRSLSLMQKSSVRKKSKIDMSFFKQLSHLNGEEDTEQQHLREMAKIELQYSQQQKKLKEEREKYMKKRLQQYHAVTDKIHDEVTFDYEGDPMKRTLRQSEAKTNELRATIGVTSKKFKEGFARITAPESFRVQSSRKQKETEDKFRTVKQLQMPLFPMKYAQPFNVKNLKLEEYRKHYGKRYSRVGVATIETVELTKGSHQDLFAEKKHLKESRGMNNTNHHFHESALRKIALPKLHGKYKVLDRYQQN